MTEMDVVIVGGGPGGLSAALALGRAQKRVLVCDAGPRRNAAAVHLHNFVTRDGTPPDAFRQAAREQLTRYENVAVRDVGVEAIAGTKGAFRVRVGSEEVAARRVLLCTGMIDQTMPIEGFAQLWGSTIFQCPYCHGWEVRGRRWGVLASPGNAAHLSLFAIQLRAWTKHVTVFTHGPTALADETLAELTQAGVDVTSGEIGRLASEDGKLVAVVLADGTRVPLDVLFAHPSQQQVPLVAGLGVALDEEGYVQVDPMTCETSLPGVYAAGDLTTRMQGAVLAAAASSRAAAMINMELTRELALAGRI